MRKVMVVCSLLCVLGCGNSLDPVDAAAGAGDTGVPSQCCPIDEPTCDCFHVGGLRANGCPAICDLSPSAVELQTDVYGCPVWVEVHSVSCFPEWDIDASVDALTKDATADDAAP